MCKHAYPDAFTHSNIRAKAPHVRLEPEALTPRGPEHYGTYKIRIAQTEDFDSHLPHRSRRPNFNRRNRYADPGNREIST